jgi:molecular chaperone GrpE
MIYRLFLHISLENVGLTPKSDASLLRTVRCVNHLEVVMSEQEPIQNSEQVDEQEAVASPVDVLEQRIVELESQLRDVQLRAQADVQNMQKRCERDIENARKFALEKFVGSLLDVVDNLDRALDATPPDQEATKLLREGIALTHTTFLEALKRNQVDVVNPLGEPFNAEFHQAVSMQPSETAEPNTVSAVLAKGYTLSGRLLRPAMVVVVAPK